MVQNVYSLFIIYQDHSLYVTQSATIVAKSSAVVAHISGVQTMSILETLHLSASKSYDPDGDKKSAVSYKWEILNMDKSAVISRSTRERVTLPQGQELYLNATGNLEVGKSYTFKLTYRVGDRER